MTWLLVAVGGAAGAVLRFLIDHWCKGRYGAGFPWGTTVVNIAGAFILGVVTGVTVAEPDGSWRLLLGTGLCGALTTYSTFSLETVELARAGRRGRAASSLVLTVVVGVAAVSLGSWLAGR